MKDVEREKAALFPLFAAVSSAKNWGSTEVCRRLRSACDEGRFLKLVEELSQDVEKRSLELGAAEIEQALENGARVVSFLDDDYPENLRGIEDPPLLLFCKGALPEKPCVGIVGARKCSAYGRCVAYSAGKELSSSGLCIVSGLAYGIDAEAHRGALESESEHPGVAVLGTGLERIYPRENRRLAESLLEKGGAIVSEYGLRSGGGRHFFPRRNRIISGLSHAVVVVEAGKRSGSLITARLALEQGRELLAVPGALNCRESDGTNRLIAEGAHLYTCGADLLRVLPEQIKRQLRPKAKRERAKAPWRKVEQFVEEFGLCRERVLQVLNLLSKNNAREFEELAGKGDISVGELQQILSGLELEGFLRVLEGERYVLTEGIDS